MYDVQDSAATSSSTATSSPATSSAAATSTAVQADRLLQRRDKQMQSCTSKATAATAKVLMCLVRLQLNIFMLALFVAGQLVYCKVWCWAICV